MPEKQGWDDLVIGGARRVGNRCIIPIIRTRALSRGGGALVSLTPVALLFAEGEDEYLALLPGTPRTIRDAIEILRDDIEREKEKYGVAITRGEAPGSDSSAPPSRQDRGRRPRS